MVYKMNISFRARLLEFIEGCDLLSGIKVRDRKESLSSPL